MFHLIGLLISSIFTMSFTRVQPMISLIANMVAWDIEPYILKKVEREEIFKEMLLSIILIFLYLKYTRVHEHKHFTLDIEYQNTIYFLEYSKKTNFDDDPYYLKRYPKTKNWS